MENNNIHDLDHFKQTSDQDVFKAPLFDDSIDKIIQKVHQEYSSPEKNNYSNESDSKKDNSMPALYDKSLRELDFENKKLTEELIEQNLKQTSHFEKISNDKSKLFMMLSQQKVSNKRLLEENATLANQINELMNSKTMSYIDSANKKSFNASLKSPISQINSIENTNTKGFRMSNNPDYERDRSPSSPPRVISPIPKRSSSTSNLNIPPNNNNNNNTSNNNNNANFINNNTHQQQQQQQQQQHQQLLNNPFIHNTAASGGVSSIATNSTNNQASSAQYATNSTTAANHNNNQNNHNHNNGHQIHNNPAPNHSSNGGNTSIPTNSGITNSNYESRNQYQSNSYNVLANHNMTQNPTQASTTQQNGNFFDPLSALQNGNFTYSRNFGNAPIYMGNLNHNNQSQQSQNDYLNLCLQQQQQQQQQQQSHSNLLENLSNLLRNGNNQNSSSNNNNNGFHHQNQQQINNGSSSNFNHQQHQAAVNSFSQEISLLQNHIMLLEKENAILRKESSVYKQQEATATLKLRETQLELKTLEATKQSLETENEELKAFAKKRTQDANARIIKMAEKNKQMNVVLLKYQKVIEKLTNEIYLLQGTTHSQMNGGGGGGSSTYRGPTTSVNNSALATGEKRMFASRSTGNLTNTEMSPFQQTEREARRSPSRERVSDFQNEELLELRQQNFKLKADLKAVAERSDSLSRENRTIKDQMATMARSQQENLFVLSRDSIITETNKNNNTNEEVGSINTIHQHLYTNGGGNSSSINNNHNNSTNNFNNMKMNTTPNIMTIDNLTQEDKDKKLIFSFLDHSNHSQAKEKNSENTQPSFQHEQLYNKNNETRKSSRRGSLVENEPGINIPPLLVGSGKGSSNRASISSQQSIQRPLREQSLSQMNVRLSN